MKARLQKDKILPRKAIGAKQRSSIDRLVDYGTDDEDTVEESPPLCRASSFVELPRSREATTGDTRESRATTTMSDSVVKMESPIVNGPKVCALYWTVPYQLFPDTIIKLCSPAT